MAVAYLRFYRVLLGFTELYCFTEFKKYCNDWVWQALGFTGFYRVSKVF